MINKKIVPILIFAVLLSPSFTTLAQSDGSARQATTTPADATPADATPATSTAATTTSTVTPATSTTATTSSATATTTKPVPSSTKPRPATVPVTATASATPQSTSTATSTSNIPIPDDEGNLLIRVVFVLLVAIPFGFMAVLLFKNKNKKTKMGGTSGKGKEENEEGSKCFDIKKLLDDKLKELTDIKGKIESEAQSKIRETAHGVLRGSTAGDMLILAEKAEKEYSRLKKLFEECQIEFGERVFRGTLVENSLADKGILQKLKIEKTRKLEDWTLHDVLVQENKIPELSEYMADGPWYIHLWQEGKDEIKVIFKHKVFTIKASDKTTWADTIAYAKTIGIPEEQLDFPIK